MSVSMYDQMNSHMNSVHPVAIARPQVGIERLPARRLSNEPRESMNCKSCRKRKIKCNRLRPSCEACQVFQCACIYDAVPKKRGPKTDVLEALLKRVDGLEAKLREKGEEDPSASSGEKNDSDVNSQDVDSSAARPAKRLALDKQNSPSSSDVTVVSPQAIAVREPTPPPTIQTDALFDTYFARFHGKPYYILDESSVRQRLQLNQLPDYLCHAICAIAARYTPHPGGHAAAVNISEEFASRARKEIDTDEPTVDALQALLLLVNSFAAAGKGKKAHMLMTSATGMATALELHREMDGQARVTPVERETRRRLFWSCYLLDRFQSTGSKRPCLINDYSIMLRLPCWSPNPSALPIEGEFFQPGSNLQYFQGSGKKSQGSTGMLIDICRILGITNRYLAAGGVKGDSHFPWHSLSNLSKIRHDLDIWASGTEHVFSSLDNLFGQADSTVLVLSKLIYHLIHCLIYRPFLPIDLSELAGNGQHQSWQIEATNMCFLHANAIAELIDLGKQARNIEWPAFVGYCICTAGTVHIHGAHYSKQSTDGEMNVFSSAADFLSREMQQLGELRNIWACVQHQQNTLQGIYNAHSELVKTLSQGSMRYTPGFHNEDFFERYSNIGGPGGRTFIFDAVNLTLSDVMVDPTTDTISTHELYAPRTLESNGRPSLKRKASAPVGRRRSDIKALSTLAPPPTPGLPTPGFARRSFSHSAVMMPQPSPGLLHTPTSLPPPPECQESRHDFAGLQGQMNNAAANNAVVAAATAAGLGLSPTTSQHGQSMAGMAGPFTPPYSYTSGPNANIHSSMINEANGGYDAMFGGLPTNAFGSPAAWNTDDHPRMHQATPAPTAPSPGSRSNHESIGTGQGDEKDPFLILLEQLAENEQRSSKNGQGSELDFFLAGTAASS